MIWHIIKDGYAPLDGERVLTYSEVYKDAPEMAYRLMDSQFVLMCREVTHFAYLTPPKHIEQVPDYNSEFSDQITSDKN